MVVFLVERLGFAKVELMVQFWVEQMGERKAVKKVAGKGIRLAAELANQPVEL
jgi:hypothetical protein